MQGSRSPRIVRCAGSIVATMLTQNHNRRVCFRLFKAALIQLSVAFASSAWPDFDFGSRNCITKYLDTRLEALRAVNRKMNFGKWWIRYEFLFVRYTKCKGCLMTLFVFQVLQSFTRYETKVSYGRWLSLGLGGLYGIGS